MSMYEHKEKKLTSIKKTLQEAVLDEVSSMRWGAFKPHLAEATIEHLKPIQARYHEVMGDLTALDTVLAAGAQAAEKEANATLENVKQAMGFPLKA